MSEDVHLYSHVGRVKYGSTNIHNETRSQTKVVLNAKQIF